MPVDVIIATCKSLEAVKPLIAEVIATAGTDVNVHATCTQVCAAKNRNIGLDLCTSPIRFMIDDDMTGFPSGWVVTLSKVMKDHPKCMMVSPQLMNPNGSFGFMLGYPPRKFSGVSCIKLQELPTACIGIRENELRFDEEYVGSGWEDTDYCAQLRQKYFDGIWLICHDVRAIHIHEMKNQQPHFETNKVRYKSKWGKLQGT